MNTDNRNNLTDKQLVDKVLNGEQAYFALLVKNTEKLVTQIVFKMIPDMEDRKDIAQDIYIKVYRKLPGFRFQSKLSTWIAQISYNTCLDQLRKKKLLLIDNNDDGEDNNEVFDTLDKTFMGRNEIETTVWRKDLSHILKTATDSLSPLYNTLITLYHQEELSYEEIGQITGLPAGTLKNYLFRARRILKNKLLLHYRKEEL